MTPTKLTRRTAFRLATTFVLLFSVTMLAIFAALYLVINRNLMANLQDEIGDLKETLVSVGSTNGRAALASMIARRTAASPDDAIFLLTDADGNYIAGNILAIPRFTNWKTVDTDALPFLRVTGDQLAGTQVLGSWAEVPDGHLFVATGTTDVQNVEDILIGGFGWVVALTALSSITGGIILGLSAQSRVDTIERALDSFSQGNLADRIKRSHTRDDLDHVAELINATLDRLQRSIVGLKQVTNDIAHDLKTPISRIRQKLEVAQLKGGDVTTFKTTIESALTDIDQVVETFEALLSITEINAGSRRARFSDVNLKSVLAIGTEALGPIAESRDHTLNCDVPGLPDAIIHGDRQLLIQLFINLIDNAIRHCPPGSTISAAVSCQAHDICIEIADNGPGIPEHEHQNVFRPLYRLEKSRTTPGSGLGLSLVAAITDLHHGTIIMQNADPGLKIMLTFPRLR